MDTTSEITKTKYGYKKNLISNYTKPRYVYIEYQIKDKENTPYKTNSLDHRTLIVIEGQVIVEFMNENGEMKNKIFNKLDGWHVFPNTIYKIINNHSQFSTVIEAGSNLGEDNEFKELDLIKKENGPPCISVSSYLVEKPWGGEVWFTQNIEEELTYALKKIWMNEGNQSSLQSHEIKMETNYVIEGKAKVLYGLIAPKDINTVIKIDDLKEKIYESGTGWSSEHRELHRVIAKSDYISIEVSTPELDDVIRWEDDTNRGHGRIVSEHVQK